MRIGFLSLRARLLLGLLACSAVVLGLAVAAFLFNERLSTRAELDAELNTRADFIGRHLQTAIRDDDVEYAGRYLSALAEYPSVIQAAVHYPDGSIMVSYLREGTAPRPSPTRLGIQRAPDSIYLYRPIGGQPEALGYVSLLVDKRQVSARRVRLASLSISVVLLGLLMTFLIALRLQHYLVRPVSGIVNTVRGIMRENDYSLRMPEDRRDEFGELMRCLNAMLSQISERDRALMERVADQTQTIRRDNLFIQGILDSVPAILIVIDHQNRDVRTVNNRFNAYFSKEPNYRDPADLLSGLGLKRELIERILKPTIIRDEPVNASIGGREYTFEINHIPLHLGDEYLLELDDVTNRTRAEREVLLRKTLVEVTLNSLSDAVITTDPAGNITYVNPVAERFLERSSEELLEQPIQHVFHSYHPSSEQPLPDPVTYYIENGQEHAIATRLVLIGNPPTKLVVECKISEMRTPDGDHLGVVLLIRDVTEVRALIAKISHQATHDALTGLLNRREFQRRLEFALSTAVSDDTEHSLLYLDLDKFKVVNDTCGHAAGDQLLVQLTQIMREKMRKGDTIARLGGDEFGILMLNCTQDKAHLIAEQLRDEISAFRFKWEHETFQVGVSVGLVGISPDTVNRESSALSLADAACYAAKEGGRNRIFVYDAQDQAFADRFGQVVWANRITRALEEDRFFLAAQKIQPIQPGDSSDAHYEILIRMLDEEGDLVPPGVFLSAAENYGLMQDLDAWVVNRVLSWCRDNPDRFSRIGKLAINLSGLSVSNAAFRDKIFNIITESEIDGARLCFEFTETAAISSFDAARSFIEVLRGPGCMFSIDDFGTGMSSFGYLKNFPADYLKIDGIFIRQITESKIDEAMVRSICQVGHALDMKIIAEFVENEDAVRILREIGIDYAQGYGIAKPVPLDDLSV